MEHQVGGGFRTPLSETDAVLVSREKLKLSVIVLVPQYHLRLSLILNMYVKYDKGIPIINDTTDRSVTPESM